MYAIYHSGLESYLTWKNPKGWDYTDKLSEAFLFYREEDAKQACWSDEDVILVSLQDIERTKKND